MNCVGGSIDSKINDDYTIKQSVNKCLISCVEEQFAGLSYTLTAIVDIFLTDTVRHVIHVNKRVDITPQPRNEIVDCVSIEPTSSSGDIVPVPVIVPSIAGSPLPIASLPAPQHSAPPLIIPSLPVQTLSVPSLNTPSLPSTSLPAPTLPIPPLSVPSLTMPSLPSTSLPDTSLHMPSLTIPSLPAPTLPIPPLSEPPLPLPSLPIPSLPIPSLPDTSLPIQSLPDTSLPIPSLPSPSLHMPSLPDPNLPMPSPPSQSLPISSLPAANIEISEQHPCDLVLAPSDLLHCDPLTQEEDDDEAQNNALSLAVIEAAMCVVEPTPSFVAPMTPYDQSICEAAACIAADAAAKEISDAADARAAETLLRTQTAQTVADVARAKAEVNRMLVNDEEQRRFGDSESRAAAASSSSSSSRSSPSSGHCASYVAGQTFDKLAIHDHYSATADFDKNSDTFSNSSFDAINDDLVDQNQKLNINALLSEKTPSKFVCDSVFNEIEKPLNLASDVPLNLCDAPLNLVSDNIPMPVIQQSLERDVFPCSFCQKVYKRYSSLKKHYQMKHVDLLGNSTKPNPLDLSNGEGTTGCMNLCSATVSTRKRVRCSKLPQIAAKVVNNGVKMPQVPGAKMPQVPGAKIPQIAIKRKASTRCVNTTPTLLPCKPTTCSQVLPSTPTVGCKNALSPVILHVSSAKANSKDCKTYNEIAGDNPSCSPIHLSSVSNIVDQPTIQILSAKHCTKKTTKNTRIVKKSTTSIEPANQIVCSIPAKDVHTSMPHKVYIVSKNGAIIPTSTNMDQTFKKVVLPNRDVNASTPQAFNLPTQVVGPSQPQIVHVQNARVISSPVDSDSFSSSPVVAIAPKSANSFLPPANIIDSVPVGIVNAKVASPRVYTSILPRRPATPSEISNPCNNDNTTSCATSLHDTNSVASTSSRGNLGIVDFNSVQIVNFVQSDMVHAVDDLDKKVIFEPSQVFHDATKSGKNKLKSKKKNMQSRLISCCNPTMKFQTRLHCNRCYKTFFSRSGLWKHRSVHETCRGDSVQCAICNRHFANRSKLNYHVSKSHPKIRKFFCEVCSNGFYLKHHLSRHMKNKHIDPKPRKSRKKVISN